MLLRLFSILISGTYMYCCVGIYCPNCPIEVYVDVFNQTFLVNSNMTMTCAENVFSFHTRGSVKPGKYPVQVRTIARSNMYLIFLFINLTFDKNGTTRNCLISLSLTLLFPMNCFNLFSLISPSYLISARLSQEKVQAIIVFLYI